MRRVLIGLLDVIVWFAIVVATLFGALAGGKIYPQWAKQALEFDWSLALVGGVSAFILAILVFGVVVLLLQIEENTRRSGEIFDALVRRARTRMDDGKP